jgi:acyl-CoA thioesterase-2
VTAEPLPPWGDASDLIDILDVQPAGEGSYTSVLRGDWAYRPVVEGSQMLGQAIVACGRHSPGRRVVSAHMVFPRGAHPDEPLRFDVDEISAGRTFTTLVVKAQQRGRVCAVGTFLLDETADDVIRHAEPAPDVIGPEHSEPVDMAVTGRDVRVVDDTYTGDPDAPVGPPVIDAWVRFDEVPDDPVLHAALLAQFTGHVSIAAALRPHAGIGQDQAHRTLSTAINAIAISFHADVRADRWMLYRHLSTFAGDGMTHSECRVHNVAGALLASFTVDAMVRPFREGTGPVDPLTSM